MTPAIAQQIVDEVRVVLARHGAALVGSCEREGVWGEIAIMDVKDVPVTMAFGREPSRVVSPLWEGQMQIEVITPEAAA